MAISRWCKQWEADKGRGIGFHQFTLTDAGKKVTPGMAKFTLALACQDQVIALPAGALLLAQSGFCSCAALSYGQAGLSFQGHPEFTADIGLIKRILLVEFDDNFRVTPGSSSITANYLEEGLEPVGGDQGRYM